jgi:circadian clock protein KaiB
MKKSTRSTSKTPKRSTSNARGPGAAAKAAKTRGAAGKQMEQALAEAGLAAPPRVGQPLSATAQAFQAMIDARRDESYDLRLYITGFTPQSRRAVQNIRKVVDKYLKGRCHLEVIDIYQQPQHALTEQIVVAPTLVKRLPPPLRRLIGDMSDESSVLLGLDLRPRPATADAGAEPEAEPATSSKRRRSGKR